MTKATSMFVLVVIVEIAAMPSAARGQPPLTVDEAVAAAVEISHRLAEMRARELGAEAGVQGRRAADRPTMTVGAGYTRTNHVEEFGVPLPAGGIRVIYPDLPNNYLTRLAFQWPIYSGGRSDALVRAADAERRAVGAELESARADLRLEVVRGYWALATAGESVRVLESALARADAHLRDVRSRFAAGFIPPNEVASAEAQRSRQEMLLIEAQNVRSSAAEDFRRLTGISGDVPLAERLGAGDPDRDPFVAAVVGVDPASRALESRTERTTLRERMAAAEERQRAAALGRRPTVALTGAVDYANPNPRIFPRQDTWRDSWDLSVNVTWLLWDGGRTRAELAEATAATAAARARLDELDSLIATDVRQRLFDLDSARAALRAAADSVRSAEEARRVVSERFTVGVATSTEALDAQVALLQAELDRTRALANLRLAEARLERAMGMKN